MPVPEPEATDRGGKGGSQTLTMTPQRDQHDQRHLRPPVTATHHHYRDLRHDGHEGVAARRLGRLLRQVSPGGATPQLGICLGGETHAPVT